MYYLHLSLMIRSQQARPAVNANASSGLVRRDLAIHLVLLRVCKAQEWRTGIVIVPEIVLLLLRDTQDTLIDTDADFFSRLATRLTTSELTH